MVYHSHDHSSTTHEFLQVCLTFKFVFIGSLLVFGIQSKVNVEFATPTGFPEETGGRCLSRRSGGGIVKDFVLRHYDDDEVQAREKANVELQGRGRKAGRGMRGTSGMQQVHESGKTVACGRFACHNSTRQTMNEYSGRFVDVKRDS
jgi:hypothetical protein